MCQPCNLFLIPVFTGLFYHFSRWLLQFVQELLSTFSDRLGGDTVHPAGIAIGVTDGIKALFFAALALQPECIKTVVEFKKIAGDNSG